MRRICLVTFGCQMNKLDSVLAREALVRAGHLMVDEPAEADVLLFNTCAVRDHAEQRVLSRIAQAAALKRERPGFLIGVMGCFAERSSRQLLEAVPALDLVCGTRWFPRLPELLVRAEAGPVVAVGEPDVPHGPHPEDLLPRDQEHPDSPQRETAPGWQAYLAVMRGCNNRCSYCIVPSVRGPEVSRPAADIVAEARTLAARGAREIVLLGQNVDAYGRDRHGHSGLAELLEAVHEGVPATDDGRLPRIRFVTSHPRDITPRLARTVRDLPRLGKHFHMPAQSGSTRVLAAMRRGYTREVYDERLAMLREECPGSTVASDFIVGFPGETEEDFAATLDLVRRAGFQNCFIFKYSPRPGTPSAETMADDVPDAVKRERNRLLLEAQEVAARERTRLLVGTEVAVLVEGISPRDPRRFIGRTPANDIVVFAPEGVPEDAPAAIVPGAAAAAGPAIGTAAAAAWTGRVRRVRLVSATALTLHGMAL